MLNVILLHRPTSCLVAGSPPACSSRFGQSATKFSGFVNKNPCLNLPLCLNTFLRVCDLWPYFGHVPCPRSSTEWFKSLAMFFFSRGCSTRFRVMASSLWRLHDYTHTHITLGSTPLDYWTARRRDLYLTKHNTQEIQNWMPPAVFEPTVPASELPQTHTLDRASTGIYCLAVT